jgi:hypothetical protein
MSAQCPPKKRKPASGRLAAVHGGGTALAMLQRDVNNSLHAVGRPALPNCRYFTMSKSPTARTMERLTESGFVCGVVERWIPQANIRKDLFGFIDLVAMNDMRLIAIQATSGSNLSARRKKIINESAANARLWLEHGEIEVWAWRKLKKKRDGKHWHPVIEHITMEDVLCTKHGAIRRKNRSSS